MTSSKSTRRGSGSGSAAKGVTPAAPQPTKVFHKSGSSNANASIGISSSSAASAAPVHRGIKKHQKDAGAPKRPLSAYMLFAREKRGEVLQQQPELKSSVKDVAKILGDMWRTASALEKQHFVAAAAKEKTKYGHALAAYKQTK
ncbi:high mobility group protein homolog NHP1 [Cyclospora cayetanensis]|uniref:Uncharacterized protein n=2 Tax=Cyclospora cayetanensis TaxID=88456 RepID=A0A1D3D8S6_9EIME|nr:high mobility group protein homolog NHP1 [Cyclospora cayetanensis]OEH79834.1 hypothetical protein cyc_02454 [Cyclospora cayetanensis]